MRLGLSASTLAKMRLYGTGPAYSKLGRRVVHRHPLTVGRSCPLDMARPSGGWCRAGDLRVCHAGCRRSGIAVTAPLTFANRVSLRSGRHRAGNPAGNGIAGCPCREQNVRQRLAETLRSMKLPRSIGQVSTQLLAGSTRRWRRRPVLSLPRGSVSPSSIRSQHPSLPTARSWRAGSLSFDGRVTRHLRSLLRRRLQPSRGRRGSIPCDFVVEPALDGLAKANMTKIVEHCFRQPFGIGEIE